MCESHLASHTLSADFQHNQSPSDRGIMSNNADFVDTLQLYRRLQEVGKGAITDELMSLQEFFDEILQLIHRCREAFLEGSNLLEIEGTIRICGDIHGQFYDLMRLQACGGPPSPHNKYLFLG